MTEPGAFAMTIGGRPVAGTAWFDVLNPATEEVVGRAPDCSRAQLDEAVEAARGAFPAWRATPLAERQRLVARIGEVIRELAGDLKYLLTAEQGKPHAAAEADLLDGARWCEAVSTLSPPVIVNEDDAERRSETHFVPIGVVGGIAPWNFPIALAMWKVAPALVAGNTMVLKPSPFTPLTTLRIGEALQAVLPPGVLNIVTGQDELGPWMTAHPGIDKISFTGSTQTGRKVMASAAATLKRVTLELGGNDAAIVLPDVDVRDTAEKLFWAAFFNAGQICIATKRVYIHADIYDELLDALTAYAATVKVGNGAHQGVDLGPIQNRLQYRRVVDLIEDARQQGYALRTAGEVPDGPGYFVPITFVDNPPDDARIVAEEQFGPVLPLMKFDSVDEAVARANASDYGLAGSVWSKDEQAALAIAGRLETGTVWINEALHVTPFASFGGHKQSGMGVENGIDGMLEYTNPQTIVLRKAGGGEA
ncbi:MAG: aldehyde dehydrogenase family protein [Sphingopyxis granuli]|uniref:aldehyde dehydrogenase family protein n=1 Tax=Sphingopyxis granuli TaxID=267128 RepID=UPI00301C070C